MLIVVVTGRYVAPEVFKNCDYDTKADVFSFALILQEVNYLSPWPVSIALYHVLFCLLIVFLFIPFYSSIKCIATGLISCLNVVYFRWLKAARHFLQRKTTMFPRHTHQGSVRLSELHLSIMLMGSKSEY